MVIPSSIAAFGYVFASALVSSVSLVTSKDESPDKIG